MGMHDERVGRRVSHRPEARIPCQYPAHAARRRAAVSIHLGHAASPVPARWRHPLHRRRSIPQVCRSRGDHWTEISADLSTNDPRSPHSGEHGVQLPATGWPSLRSRVAGHGGSDLGRHERREGLPKNGGGAWTDLTEAVAGVGRPKPTFVSTVVASTHEAARVRVEERQQSG